MNATTSIYPFNQQARGFSLKVISGFAVMASLLVFISCGPSELEKAQTFLKLERYEDALKMTELAILDDPKNAKAYLLQGEVYLYQGDYPKAEEAFGDAIMSSEQTRSEVGDIYFACLNFKKEELSSQDIIYIKEKTRLYNPGLIDENELMADLLKEKIKKEQEMKEAQELKEAKEREEALANKNVDDRGKFKQAQRELRAWGEAVESFRVDNRGRVPQVKSFSELAQLLISASYIRNAATKDPWGNEYRYTTWQGDFSQRRGGENDYSLACGGADGVLSGDTELYALLQSGNSSVVSRTSTNWDCDILYQMGQFSWGSCR